MLSPADNEFLIREREQKALFRAQAQAQSDISETLSEPEMEEDEDEDEDEIEIEEIEVSEPVLNHLPLERDVEETSPIVVTPQQNQEQALELLKSAFEQIKLALSLLNDQKLKEEVETVTKTLAPVAEESTVTNEKETFASKLKKPVVAIKATEPVAPKVKKPVIVTVAEKPVAIKAPETVAPKAKKPVAIKAPEPVFPVTENLVAIKASGSSAQITKKPFVQVDAEPVASVPVASSKDNQEFQVVLPKKSKNKSAIVPPIPAVIIEQKDEFPSLGSSSSPVPKTGFWSSGKSSLEIAKTVAQKPSPPPIRSPTLLRIMKAGSGSIAQMHDEEEDDNDDDEFRHRKVDDYWQ